MDNKYKVFFYKTEVGRCLAEEFLGSLPLKIRAKIVKWIKKLYDARLRA